MFKKETDEKEDRMLFQTKKRHAPNISQATGFVTTVDINAQENMRGYMADNKHT